uniref:Uncharacterized protein n=1 Tax=Anguilla anguilla TaxID=7936 RepID=A0A0E9WDQ9_ANGAN
MPLPSCPSPTSWLSLDMHMCSELKQVLKDFFFLFLKREF